MNNRSDELNIINDIEKQIKQMKQSFYDRKQEEYLVSSEDIARLTRELMELQTAE